MGLLLVLLDLCGGSYVVVFCGACRGIRGRCFSKRWWGNMLQVRLAEHVITELKVAVKILDVTDLRRRDLEAKGAPWIAERRLNHFRTLVLGQCRHECYLSLICVGQCGKKCRLWDALCIRTSYGCTNSLKPVNDGMLLWNTLRWAPPSLSSMYVCAPRPGLCPGGPEARCTWTSMF